MKSKVVGTEGHVTSFSKDSIVDDNMKFKPVLLAKTTPSLQGQQTPYCPPYCSPVHLHVTS